MGEVVAQAINLGFISTQMVIKGMIKLDEIHPQRVYVQKREGLKIEPCGTSTFSIWEEVGRSTKEPEEGQPMW